MITLAQAQQWTQKYCNVKIINNKGEHFRVDIFDKDGILIWREWNFEDCSELIKCVHQYGIEYQMFAHILHTSVVGMPMVCIIITQDFLLEPNKNYTAVMVSDKTEAESVALKRNAIIVTSDKATQ